MGGLVIKQVGGGFVSFLTDFPFDLSVEDDFRPFSSLTLAQIWIIKVC